MATAQAQAAKFSSPTESSPSPVTPPEHRVHVLLSLSDEMEERVEDLISRTGYDKGELFNIAIACFKLCLDAAEDGHRVGVVDDDREMAVEFSGFHKNDPANE